MIAPLFLIVFLGHSFVLWKKPQWRRVSYAIITTFVVFGAVGSVAVGDMVPDLGMLLAVFWIGCVVVAVALAELWVFCMQKRKKS